MAKRQIRIRQEDIRSSRTQWLGGSLSVVLLNGAVFEVRSFALQEETLLCKDHFGGKHSFLLCHIKELILDYPVTEHAQTSAD